MNGKTVECPALDCLWRLRRSDEENSSDILSKIDLYHGYGVFMPPPFSMVGGI